MNEFVPLSKVSYLNDLILTGGGFDSMLTTPPLIFLEVSDNVTVYVAMCTSLGGCSYETQLPVVVHPIPPTEITPTIDELLSQVNFV